MNTPSSESQLLELFERIRLFSPRYYEIIFGFYSEYKNAVSFHEDFETTILPQFVTLIKKVCEQFQNPYQFPPYHQKIRKPFDYYQLGINLIRPLVDFSKSKLLGLENLSKIAKQLQARENVILLANHQTEVDPQLIDLMLQESFEEIGRDMIFVAGERVVLDPNAIPFSMGRDLLCIYSKKYIDNPPEEKEEKLQHNGRTMKLMSDLLSEGGKVIYVAPSGGRDRKDRVGNVEPAPFDPTSVEMFYLMAKKAKKETHFYPLALKTYDLLPPPSGIQKELGEIRLAKYTPIGIYFGAEINMESFSGSELTNRQERRQARTKAIHAIVVQDYEKIGSL